MGVVMKILLFSQVKLNQRKKKRTKTKYENKNKKFSLKKTSVGEIRRYRYIALNGRNWEKVQSRDQVKNIVCIRNAMV